MKNRLFILCQALLFLSFAAVSQEPKPAPNAHARTLKVQLNYTGAGTVSQSHKIFAVLWDSPDFVQGGSMPVTLKPATAKDELVTFENVQKVPAYVSTVFDPSGGWDGQSGPPPAGASLGLYHKEGVPLPIDIAEGKTVTVTVTFDDEIKMK